MIEAGLDLACGRRIGLDPLLRRGRRNHRREDEHHRDGPTDSVGIHAGLLHHYYTFDTRNVKEFPAQRREWYIPG